MEAEVRKRHGLPTLHIDGRPFPPILAYVRPGYLPDFRDAGIHIYTSPLSSKALSAARFWTGIDEYDFAETRQLADSIFERDPNALLLPRIALGYAEAGWFPHEHPDELSELSNGKRGMVRDDGTRVAASSGHSFASKVWRDGASQALRAYIEFMESHYPERIIGYHVGGGISTEWVEWNVHNRKHLSDYSRPMEERFSEWLVERGPSWNERGIPSPTERMEGGHLSFRDPERDARSIEYSRCLSQTISETMLHLCRVAKRCTSSSRLVGAFYGYLWTHGETLCPQHAGHLCLGKILRSPDIDFIVSPYHYDDRGLGGVNYPQTLADEVRNSGKLYFNEVDTKTFLTDPQIDWMSQIARPRNAGDTIELLKRDFSYSISKGVGLWWMDLMDRGWFHHPTIARALGRLRGIYDSMDGEGAIKAAPSQIAVVLDEQSFHYLMPHSNLTSPLLSVQRQRELSGIGAPFDEVLLDSLSADHSLYIFLNAFYLEDEDRARMQRTLEGKGSLWVYAPGFIGGDGADIGGISEILGMNVRMLDREMPLDVVTGRSRHPIMSSVAPGTRFGCSVDGNYIARALNYPAKRAIGPVFYVDDREVIELGRIAGTDRTGLSLKEGDEGLRVYSSAPAVPSDIMRGLAKYVGVHCYLESNDLVYAGPRFLGIYARTGGLKRVRLPTESRVYDLYEERVVAETCNSLEMHMRANSTVMLQLDPQ